MGMMSARLLAILFHLCLAASIAADPTQPTKATCKHTHDCEGDNFQCIDRRCVCNPLWGYAGYDCTEMRWGSWALLVVLVFVSVFSVTVLASGLVKLDDGSSKCCAGLVELVKILFRRSSDSGSTTVRVVLMSTIIDILSYLWKMLTVVGTVSHTTSAYWHARLVFPVSEGCMVLPCALVVSVWVDVANSSMSRSKSKKRLERTKKFLQLGTAFYIILLLLMSTFDNLDLAMVVQLGAIGVGMTACGSGAAKLCNTLRALGASSAGIADNVFKVSRSMGISLYGVFIGNTMLLSSRTRKSDPANLALFGFLVSSLGKCFLHKAIFEYMVESTRAKKARLIASANMNKRPILSFGKPAVRLIESVREMRNRNRKIGRVAVVGQQDNSRSATSEAAINAAPPVSKQGKFEGITEGTIYPPGENHAVADDVRADVKVQEGKISEESFESLRMEARLT